MPALPIHRVTRFDLRLVPWSWPFADQRRDEIAAHFAELRRARPELWNGPVLMGRNPVFSGDCFSADYFESDFASFMAWRDWGFPDRTVFNGFGVGALRGSDGAFVLGEMGAHTANAGRIYFPSGTPDPNDISDGHVDIAGSVVREVEEETGLTAADYLGTGQWHCVVSGCLIALVQVLDCALTGDTLQRRIEAELSRQALPELSAIHIVRAGRDITAAMPEYVKAFMGHIGLPA